MTINGSPFAFAFPLGCGVDARIGSLIRRGGGGGGRGASRPAVALAAVRSAHAVEPSALRRLAARSAACASGLMRPSSSA